MLAQVNGVVAQLLHPTNYILHHGMPQLRILILVLEACSSVYRQIHHLLFHRCFLPL